MIIDDAHRAAFVHIPKCGGTSVSLQFSELDSCAGAFRRKGVHPVLGSIHYAHIPLAYLKQHYPDEFEKVATYRSFALVRDPYERFASATFQRLEEFGGASGLDVASKLDITSKQALGEARAVMRWLGDRGAFCDLEYIHFSRQVDYVELAGRPIVGHVFPLENISDMAAALEASCGVRFDPERRENTNFASNNRLLALLHVAKPIYSRLTSWSFRERVLLTMRRWKVSGPGALYAAFRQDREVSRFIETYYAGDFALYDAAKDRLSRTAAERAPASAVGEPNVDGLQTAGTPSRR